eukprot:SAG31_NODE_3623_length_4058_cov_5.815863_1_plen_58_part_00
MKHMPFSNAQSLSSESHLFTIDDRCSLAAVLVQIIAAPTLKSTSTWACHPHERVVTS